MDLKSSLRGLRSRNYRLFFIGQGVSLIGTWMQRLAMAWLVYRLTDSAFLLGLVGFTGLIPVFLLTPFTGVFVDRWNRHHIIIVTQALATLQAIALTFLVGTHLITIWQIIVLSLLLGIVNAFDVPARQSFVVMMVDRREDLPSAIALNSMMFNAARLVGPSLAGIALAAFGEWVCFLLNALSFLAVIASLLAMRVPRHVRFPQHKNVIEGLREGLLYTWRNRPIRAVLILLAVISLMGMPYTTLMPVFAKDILHGGPSTLGFLMATTGIGAIVAALWVASRRAPELGREIPLATALFSVGVVAFGFSHILWISLVLTVVMGFGQIVQNTMSNTVVQTVVDEDKRGRVMSLYTISLMGMAPFGNLLAGVMADTLGATNTLMIDGVICLVAAAIFGSQLPSLRRAAGPMYARMTVEG